MSKSWYDEYYYGEYEYQDLDQVDTGKQYVLHIDKYLTNLAFNKRIMEHVHEIYEKNEEATNIIRFTTDEEEEKKAVAIAQHSQHMSQDFFWEDRESEEHQAQLVREQVRNKIESKHNFKLLEDESCFNLVTMDTNGRLYGLTAGE